MNLVRAGMEMAVVDAVARSLKSPLWKFFEGHCSSVTTDITVEEVFAFLISYRVNLAIRQHEPEQKDSYLPTRGSGEANCRLCSKRLCHYQDESGLESSFLRHCSFESKSKRPLFMLFDIGCELRIYFWRSSSITGPFHLSNSQSVDPIT